jgi:HlyD family secretion protein
MAAFLSGCDGRNRLSDAYGNFETREYLVSSEGQGRILELDIEEGIEVTGGKIVGCIDTIPLHLQKKQLEARIHAVEAQKANVVSQIAVHEARMENLMIEKNRLENLLADGAATGKQMDDLSGQIATMEKQILATRSNFKTIGAEIAALHAQVRITQDQLERNLIINPINGTVLEKYAEPFELALPGKTLYKVADLHSMILRVYISGEQLASVQLGQEVDVIIDDPKTLDTPLKGRITWISDESEFTPKIIQTRKERVNLVYAVKVEVHNDGRLKIGMPGEVIL